MLKKNQSTAVEKAITYYHICMDEDTVEKQGVDPIIKVCVWNCRKEFTYEFWYEKYKINYINTIVFILGEWKSSVK